MRNEFKIKEPLIEMVTSHDKSIQSSFVEIEEESLE